ncbi:hypothetical protein BJF78_03885 [Pseudonocardia sp. CNS-139]|nr:hypothetical protein BJF78_03885 [Pseudonocardia sp. CNS-139]
MDVAALRLDGPPIHALHSRAGPEPAGPGDRVPAALPGGAVPPPLLVDGDPGEDLDARVTGAPLLSTAGDVLGAGTAAGGPVGEPGRVFAVPVDLAREASFSPVTSA